MNGGLLLETAKWRDVVELGLCMAIHDVCNDSQFENCTPLDFANFLNVREEAKSIAVLPKEKLRVCYMVFAVASNISPRKEAETWVQVVPATLRHRQVILRQAPFRHLRRPCHRGQPELPQIH